MQARERHISNTSDKHGQAREREREAKVFSRATRLSDIGMIGDIIRGSIMQKIRNGTKDGGRDETPRTASSHRTGTTTQDP
jgi:hypothetical protein